MTVSIRSATPDDARTIARVQIATWRAAYAGLVPAAHLDSLSLEARSEMWRRLLSGDDGAGSGPARPDDPTGKGPSATWVAVDGRGRVIGFADVGPSRDTDAVGRIGEVRAIYVLEEHWGRGVGHALLERSHAWLRRFQYATASLWVLEGNDRARRFYERHGWRLDGTSATVDLVGEEVTEIRYRLDVSRATA